MKALVWNHLPCDEAQASQLALALGLLLGHVFQPGTGMNVDPRTLDASAMSAYASNADKLTSGGTVDFLMKLIPTTVVNAR